MYEFMVTFSENNLNCIVKHVMAQILIIVSVVLKQSNYVH